jgi:hypothetical protein
VIGVATAQRFERIFDRARRKVGAASARRRMGASSCRGSCGNVRSEPEPYAYSASTAVTLTKVH